ncbi:LysR family transcriptional regulator [Sulfitobacter sp. M22]|uniref:LysR family transcriptional regulator n=1 Tax=Sulfitobacter sp. M22 TaxID=2675332 RepID=UPI001F436D12|nr:LysR family transcriptional regulator [Sulfitobacter sp. M22]
MKTIELRHLRYVAAAAEHGSFRQAALAEGVRVSAISRRIRDLEDDVGATLFIRHSAGVRLTQAGQHFVSRKRHALRQIDIATQEAGANGRGEIGLLRIRVDSGWVQNSTLGAEDAFAVVS